MVLNMKYVTTLLSTPERVVLCQALPAALPLLLAARAQLAQGVAPAAPYTALQLDSITTKHSVLQPCTNGGAVVPACCVLTIHPVCAAVRGKFAILIISSISRGVLVNTYLHSEAQAATQHRWAGMAC